MKIAIASAKGGTGKTTVSTCLAQVLADTGMRVRYLDCDVEEPNGHLFLHPELTSSEPVNVSVPEVDADRCNGCGLCARICQYAAVACVKKKVLVFPELCHGCGGCVRVCPQGAITEVGRAVGVMESGAAGDVAFVQGCLRIGEAMSPPLIRTVRETQAQTEVDLIDAPPGTSCPVITAIRGVDFIILVTEPTPFGLSDLSLAIDMVRELGIPHAVVVNRHEDTNLSAREFCAERNIEIAAEIPDDRRIAEAYSRGELPVTVVTELAAHFTSLWEQIQRIASAAARKDPA